MDWSYDYFTSTVETVVSEFLERESRTCRIQTGTNPSQDVLTRNPETARRWITKSFSGTPLNAGMTKTSVLRTGISNKYFFITPL